VYRRHSCSRGGIQQAQFGCVPKVMRNAVTLPQDSGMALKDSGYSVRLALDGLGSIGSALG